MKTVFVLGAVFSKEAGAPMQAEIMGEIFKIHQEDSNYFNGSDFQLFENLLTEQLYYKREQFKDVQIEDMFTPLDRCLADNIQFRGLSIEQMTKTRDAVFNIIGLAIRRILERKGNSKEYIDHFAEYLVRKCSKRLGGNYRQHDPVSVISTNWDILLDNSLYDYIQRNYHGRAVVDYCCYISSLEERDETVKPGLEMLGAGGFNVKLLKIHGSLNWLQCSRCMRLYVGFNKKIGVARGATCRHCDKNHDAVNKENRLISNLIMPTFLKDLSNPQYKIIWQNAGIELSEADKIIFIGYSLPNADFEMRQLLSRMIKRSVKIEVVTYERDKEKEKDIKKYWQAFFGEREVKVHLCGASQFIEQSLYLE